ncbi:MAG: transcriptional regulator, partial [Actinobacteria bacterium]
MKGSTLPLVRPAECCPAIAAVPISKRDADVTSTLFKALSDPHRVRIVNLLATTE